MDKTCFKTIPNDQEKEKYVTTSARENISHHDQTYDFTAFASNERLLWHCLSCLYLFVLVKNEPDFFHIKFVFLRLFHQIPR